jgi:catechol 2,3-dioxygenase-like lactoylglutathione lyase family enzyme
MPTLGFSHYNLCAARPVLDELRDFYRDVVGLAVGPRPAFKSFGYWLYAGDEAVLHLSESSPDETPPGNGRRGATNTFDHAAFSCSGRAAFERHLAERGIAFRQAEVPLTGQVQLFFSDPAGNGVELNFASSDD